MPRFHDRRTRTLPVLLAMSLAACGSSDDGGPTAPDPQATQGATAVATPPSTVISRGGTTNVTVVFTAIGGVTISSITINRPYPGISVVQSSNQTSGNTVTRVFAISADNSVPLGSHAVRFSPSISGATVTPQITNATFTLTVTQ